MIRNYKHAEDVQRRRYAAGKRGTSKAVRRFYKQRDNCAAGDLRDYVRWGKK